VPRLSRGWQSNHAATGRLGSCINYPNPCNAGITVTQWIFGSGNNPTLPSVMFGSRLALPAQSVRMHSSCELCGVCVSALSSLSCLCSGAPSGRHSALNFPSLSPFPAILTSHLQLAENKTTLSPAVATLTSRVKHKSFACHSCKKHPGWGYVTVNFFVAQTSVCVLLRQHPSESSPENDPQELRNLAVHQITSYESALTASALFLPPLTSHHSQITKSCRIRTSKTQHLKPFRMNRVEKPTPQIKTC